MYISGDVESTNLSGDNLSSETGRSDRVMESSPAHPVLLLLLVVFVLL